MSVVVIDRIKEFVENMELVSNVLDLSDDGTNTILTVENVFHIRALPAPNRRTVLIDGDSYDVIAVDYQLNTVTIIGVITEASVYKVPNPFFFTGTLVSTGNEIACLHPNQKCPMIYLNQIIKGKKPNNSDADFYSPVRMAFADYYSNDYTNDDHINQVLRPLENLARYVFNQWDNEGCLSLTGDIDWENVPKWGTLVTAGKLDKKTSKKSFNEYLDAILWQAPLRFCNC